MQFTEISAEPLVGFHIQRLIAKEQNLVLSQRLMQLLDLPVAERRRQRDAFNFGTDARCHRRNVDGFVAHGATFPSAQINRSRVRAYPAQKSLCIRKKVPRHRG
jgi:hypothetical protein